MALRPPLVVVAHAVDPGPGGPESHVNTRFLRALADGWGAPVAVVTGGDPPRDGEGAPLAERPGWTVHALGPAGGRGAPRRSLRRLAAAGVERLERGSRVARLANRLVYWATGHGLKLAAWERATATAIRRELDRLPGAVVVSRALPWVSIGAVDRVRRRRRFGWIVNVNDPLPPDVWGGLYGASPHTSRKIRLALARAIPRIDGFSFPCRDLRDLELAAFPAMAERPTAILPHVADPAIRLDSADPRDELVVAFAGTLRQTRAGEALAEGLRRLGARRPEVAARLRLAFHLARPSSVEAQIAALPVPTETTRGLADAELERALAGAAAFLDLEAEEDRPLLLTKVVAYLGLRRPILAACAEGGTTWRLIRERGLGWAVPIGDPDGLATAFAALHDGRRAGTLPAPDPTVGARFSGERQVADLARLIAAAATGRRGALGEDWP